MNVYEYLAHETFVFLGAANELLEAAVAGNDARLRKAVDGFRLARFPDSQIDARGEAIDDAWKRLVALAGSSEASPTRSNYQFCHRLHDFLFYDIPRQQEEHSDQDETPVSEYESSIIFDPTDPVPTWRDRPRPTPTWRQDFPELIIEKPVVEEPEPCHIQPAIDALRSDEGRQWIRSNPKDLASEWEKMLDEAARAKYGRSLKIAPEARNDGPVELEVFEWNGQRYRLPGKAWKLLNYLWDKPGRTAKKIDAAIEIWDDETAASDKIRGVQYRVQNFFLEKGLPFEIHSGEEMIAVESLPRT